MQDIPQETHHETTRLTQSAQVVLRSRINKFCSRFPMCGYRLTIHWI